MIRYRPGIGDPTFVGWLTTIFYLIAAVLLWRTYTKPKKNHIHHSQTPKQILSIILSLIFLFLAVNKQLDLQTLFRDVGREIALYQGWFADRRFYQQCFVIALASVGFMAMLFYGYWMRKEFLRKWLMLVGLILITTFVFFRAAQFHHFENVLPMEAISNNKEWSWILEIGGLFCVILQSIFDLRNPTKPIGE